MKPTSSTESAYNFRDLGDLPSKEGRLLPGFFVRSKNLHAMESAFKRVVLSHDVSLVVDLRGRMEREKAEDDMDFLEEYDILYANVPICDILHYGTIESLHGALFEDYKDILLTKREEIGEVFHLFLRHSGTVLFHCNSGKDRTGVVAMLLLALFGYDRESILLDYTETERNMPALRRQGTKNFRKDLPEFCFHTTRETGERTLDFLDSLGGVSAYLETCNFKKEAQAELLGKAGRKDR